MRSVRRLARAARPQWRRALSLAREHPDVYSLIDASRTPAEALSRLESGGRDRVWLRCAARADHRSWLTTPRQVLECGARCPECISEGPLLSSSHADLHSELLVERLASPALAAYLTANSREMCWWRCPSGHEWQGTPESRVLECPFCARPPTDSARSLVGAMPLALRQWDPYLNGSLDPSKLFLRSHSLVYWRCPRRAGHVWLLTVHARVKLDGSLSECPFCCGLRALRAASFGAQHASMLSQWHYARNGQRDPFRLPATSSVSVWWRCLDHDEHVWRAPVSHMARAEPYCPFCQSRKRSSSKRAWLESLGQWDASSNRPLLPEDFSSESSILIDWRCRDDPRHHWCNTMHNHKVCGLGAPAFGVTARAGCPICEVRRAEEADMRENRGRLEINRRVAAEILSGCESSS